MSLLQDCKARLKQSSPRLYTIVSGGRISEGYPRVTPLPKTDRHAVWLFFVIAALVGILGQLRPSREYGQSSASTTAIDHDSLANDTAIKLMEVFERGGFDEYGDLQVFSFAKQRGKYASLDARRSSVTRAQVAAERCVETLPEPCETVSPFRKFVLLDAGLNSVTLAQVAAERYIENLPEPRAPLNETVSPFRKSTVDCPNALIPEKTTPQFASVMDRVRELSELHGYQKTRSRQRLQREIEKFQREWLLTPEESRFIFDTEIRTRINLAHVGVRPAVASYCKPVLSDRHQVDVVDVHILSQLAEGEDANEIISVLNMNPDLFWQRTSYWKNVLEVRRKQLHERIPRWSHLTTEDVVEMTELVQRGTTSGRQLAPATPFDEIVLDGRKCGLSDQEIQKHVDQELGGGDVVERLEYWKDRWETYKRNRKSTSHLSAMSSLNMLAGTCELHSPDYGADFSGRKVRIHSCPYVKCQNHRGEIWSVSV